MPVERMESGGGASSFHLSSLSSVLPGRGRKELVIYLRSFLEAFFTESPELACWGDGWTALVIKIPK